MEGWKQITIGDLGKVVTGNTPPKKDPANYGGEYPFIKPTDMEIDRRHVTEWEENYSEKAFKRYHRSYIPPKATGVVTIGTVGEKLFQADRWCFTNQSVNVVIPNEELYDPDFVYYMLKVNLPKVENANPGTASGRHHVSKSNFCAIKIWVPEHKETQHKIASILSAYDDLIENNLKRIKLLEEKAQLTYEEWFVRMKFPGHETTPINKETGLPEGWERKKINEIADFQNGYAFYTKGYSDSGYAVIDLANVSEWGDLNITGKEKFISEELYESFPKFHLQKYDIIIAMTDVTSALRILAKSAIIDKDNTYALNQRVGMLRPNTDLFDYSFLYALLSDIRFIERMKTLSKGAVQFYFNTKDIVNYETFVPSKEIIDEFVKQYKPILELRMKLKDQNNSLKEARDILLPRLMTGMIDVEQMKLENLQPTTA